MNYTIEIIDAWGRRRAWFEQTPLLEAVRRTPDQPDEIRGLLPKEIAEIGPGCTVRVLLDGQRFAEATVSSTAPEWGDNSKLILDKLVPLHEIVAFEAKTDPVVLNQRVARSYTNREISTIVQDLVQAAPGPLHYKVAHAAYPDGALREYTKFLARKTPENELPLFGLGEGDWVGGARIDTTDAYAKDGDTIAGVKVDGVAWPDLRLLMIDCEETSRNSHTFKLHPETEFWTDAEYAGSGYKLQAEAAKTHLQGLLDTHGISHIELNPHRGASGNYDDRVDAYGRYIALIYGGTRCFNADMVEAGHADIYLYENGKNHVPEMALKDYYSYTAPNSDSVVPSDTMLEAFDANGGAMESLATLAYAAQGFALRVDAAHAITFAPADTPQHVVYYDPQRMNLRLGRDVAGVANVLYLAGNPLYGGLEKTCTRGESIDEYGVHTRRLEYFSLRNTADLSALGTGILDDLAYPEVMGELECLGGWVDVQPGDCIELRGAPIRRIERELPDEYGGAFTGKLVARALEVAHRFAGTRVLTRVKLGPPMRSVLDPLAYMTRSQPVASALFEFRLDDPAAALDLGFHLD